MMMLSGFLIFCLLSFAAIVPLFTEATCPNFQLLHTVDGQSICCNPVFNCPFGTQVKFCKENGSRDTCEQCPWRTVNKQMSSSVSSVDIHTCFNVTDSHKKCPLDDTEKVNENVICPGFPCRCRWEACYFGEPCIGACSMSSRKCGINEEMNRSTGVCEPCKRYMFKNETGCQPCLWNETEWRLANSDEDLAKSLNVTQDITSAMSSINSTTETRLVLKTTSIAFQNYSTAPLLNPVLNNEGQQNNMFILVVITSILAGLLALVLLVIVAVFCVRRRRNSTRKKPQSANECGAVFTRAPDYEHRAPDHVTNGHADASYKENEDTSMTELGDDGPLMVNLENPAHKPVSSVRPTFRAASPAGSVPYREMSLLPSNNCTFDNTSYSNVQRYHGAEQTSQKHA